MTDPTEAVRAHQRRLLDYGVDTHILLGFVSDVCEHVLRPGETVVVTRLDHTMGVLMHLDPAPVLTPVQEEEKADYLADLDEHWSQLKQYWATLPSAEKID